jgi:inhibitor of KinA
LSWGDPAASALGDSAITISFGAEPGRATTNRVRAIGEAIRAARIPHTDEVISAYAAITVFYDSLHASYGKLSEELLSICSKASLSPNPMDARQHRIPVVYKGQDLDAVAAATRLSREQVIELHSSVWYTVDLLGFVPGFAFLSEIAKRLELPRRPQPRPKVPAGSVAIARNQTGIYPFDTPGGWHILGHTDVILFDPNRPEPALLHAGDRVKFDSVE